MRFNTWVPPLIFFALLMGVIALGIFSARDTQIMRAKCEQQGGVAITERGLFKACVDKRYFIEVKP